MYLSKSITHVHVYIHVHDPYQMSNIRHLQNVSDKKMFNTAFLKNEGKVLIRTFGYKLSQV